MNVSRSHDGHLFFYRIEKFVLKKKLEHFKERANGIILGSQFSLKIGILTETQDWDTKAFVLKIVLIPAHIRLIWLLNLLTFFLRANFSIR